MSGKSREALVPTLTLSGRFISGFGLRPSMRMWSWRAVLCTVTAAGNEGGGWRTQSLAAAGAS